MDNLSSCRILHMYMYMYLPLHCYSFVIIFFQNKDQQITKEDLQKIVEETKLRTDELKKAHKIELDKVIREATANKEALEKLEQQYHLKVCELFVNICLSNFC